MLGERLKELRESKNWTRKYVAEQLNIDQSTYGKYELNKREPDKETLTSLADFFNVSTDYLLGRENKVESESDNDEPDKKVYLSEKDLKEIKIKAEHIKSTLMGSVGLAFDGKPQDEATYTAVMAALEEGMMLAKKEAKEKYTPKKYRK